MAKSHLSPELLGLARDAANAANEAYDTLKISQGRLAELGVVQSQLSAEVDTVTPDAPESDQHHRALAEVDVTVARANFEILLDMAGHVTRLPEDPFPAVFNRTRVGTVSPASSEAVQDWLAAQFARVPQMNAKMLAERASVTQSQLSRWRNGQAVPAYDKMVRLAGAFAEARDLDDEAKVELERQIEAIYTAA